MVPAARIERAASYFKNARSRLSYGGDGAREGGRLPDLRVTRAALSAELRGQENSHTAGSNPAKNARCLKPPFAAPPKGTSTGSAGHLMSLQGRPS